MLLAFIPLLVEVWFMEPRYAFDFSEILDYQSTIYFSPFWMLILYKLQEGKLRVLQFDGAHGGNSVGPNYFTEENMAVAL